MNLNRLNPIAAVRRRFERWWTARLRATDSLLLTQRNVYILPTGAGWMLAATLLVLLIASINYQLNLGYLLTFMLAGSAVVGMHLCHGTLRGITLNLIAPEPVFMGENAVLNLKLISNKKAVRYGIGMRVMGVAQQAWAHTDVPALGSSPLQIAWAPPTRGINTLPTLTAETRFPLGTFRVWTVWRPAATVLAYPTPEPFAPPLPPCEPQAQGRAAVQRNASGEFDGVRPYRRGDPLKTIAWQKSAKALALGTGDLISRDDQHSATGTLWLDSSQTGHSQPELRLSRLCAWVLQADAQGLNYGLRLAGTADIAPATGEAHRRRCLEALARC